MRRARRTTKVRSVTSWTSPRVHSFWASVDDEGADAEGGGVLGFAVGGGFGRGVGNLAGGAESDAVDFGGLGGGGERADEDEEQWH